MFNCSQDTVGTLNIKLSQDLGNIIRDCNVNELVALWKWHYYESGEGHSYHFGP